MDGKLKIIYPINKNKRKYKFKYKLEDGNPRNFKEIIKIMVREYILPKG